jgi:hypothetical protein
MKTRRQIYIEAARLVDAGDEEFSCVAIDRVLGSGWRTKERLAYNAVFNPFADGDPNGYLWPLVSRRVRVLLLCLMAECWRDFVNDQIHGD